MSWGTLWRHSLHQQSALQDGILDTCCLSAIESGCQSQALNTAVWNMSDFMQCSFNEPDQSLSSCARILNVRQVTADRCVTAILSGSLDICTPQRLRGVAVIFLNILTCASTFICGAAQNKKQKSMPCNFMTGALVPRCSPKLQVMQLPPASNPTGSQHYSKAMCVKLVKSFGPCKIIW